MRTPTPTAKLTKISAAAMDIIETSYDAGHEIDAEECVGVVFTKTTVTASPEFFDRVAEDLERNAEGWRDGDYSIAYNANRDLSASFVEAADERIAKALDVWAMKCRDLAPPSDLVVELRNEVKAFTADIRGGGDPIDVDAWIYERHISRRNLKIAEKAARRGEFLVRADLRDSDY